MTSSIPSGFSSEELQRMLAEARPEPTEETTLDPKSDDYREKLMAAADKFCEMATDEVCDPMIHKAMIVCMCTNFIRFHMTTAEDMLKDGETEMAFAWARDAGKFQAMLNILATVVCGENDFLTE